jgi:uncharacterized membrane protein
MGIINVNQTTRTTLTLPTVRYFERLPIRDRLLRVLPDAHAPSEPGITADMPSPTPTVPLPKPASLSTSLKRNIQALENRRREETAAGTREERIAEAVTLFTGSMVFVYIHLALYGAWILVNLGFIPGVPQFDPSFVVLAMEASVEAIFLSTFVLISQNRMAAAADKRADLDLQISLLTEHELTKLSELVVAIAERLDIQANADPELQEVQQDVAPEAVLDEIEARQQGG